MACELLQGPEEKAVAMTDFAGTIIARLTSATSDRAGFARQCVSEFDRNEDGTIGAAEFQHVFASLQRIEEITGGATTSYVASGCRPTLFGCTLFPTYSNAFAASAYQATAMLDRFDHNGDGAVSFDELAADPAETPPASDTSTDPGKTDEPVDPTPPDPPPPDVPPPLTAAQRADALLASYDTTGKGYITIEDVVNAWLKDPSLGDIANAGTAIEAWDMNGDGQVSRDDIIAAYQLMDAADTTMAALAPGADQIELANLNDEVLNAVELTRAQVEAWDTDRNGAVSRTELVDGLKLMQIAAAADAERAVFEAMVARYDANGDGAINLDEFAKALGTVSLDEAAQHSIFTAWDTDGDGAIAPTELQKGYAAIKDAQTTIAAYDIDQKGYIDLADLQRVIDQNGATEGQASAEDIMLAWDRDGDGRVSVQDVLTMKQAMTTSNV